MSPAPITDDPAAAGRRLQLTRAAQWFAGTQDDPYALLLRAEVTDPTPYEERIRAHGPFFRSEPLDTWVTAGRAVADEVIASPAFDGLTADGRRPGARELPLSGTALDADRATYERFGALTAWGGPLMPAPHERALRESAERRAHALLDGVEATLAAGGTVDLVDAYARRLPALVLREQLGVPEESAAVFDEALAGCRRTLDGLLCPQLLADAVAGARAEAELAAVLASVLRGTPAGREPGAVAAARALAVGAAEPATTLVCNAVQELLAHPGQWAELARDPRLAAAAVTETLRAAPPVRLERRVARQDTEVAGERIPAGGRVVILVAAVNRVPAAGSADSGSTAAATGASPTAPHGDGRPLTAAPFDLTTPAPTAASTRTSSRPALSASGSVPGPFGLPGDLHFRLAGPLVRTVAEAALGALAARLPGLRAAGPAVRRRRSPVLHGHARFPVAADRAARDLSATAAQN
ncbi:cytochrome P450 [Streptomyces sp. NRRL S-118]|uniref:cytochrome P450 family protein n=1 Tax=Streptomyces sp. NRRL S-118 TaxID=1463881 RepID=UPI0004C8757B|nr:cytochrome P450 [Streptomyces sp. NRRL S-118]